MGVSGRGFTFCPMCGGQLTVKALAGENRLVCMSCGYVLYENPLPGVGIIVISEDRVLLVKREGSYGRGKWSFPAGFVEWDEDIRDAAAREVEEETGLKVKIIDVFSAHSNFHDPSFHTIGIWFTSTILGGTLTAGDDAAEAAFFSLDALPDDIAFESDRLVLDEVRQRLLG